MSHHQNDRARAEHLSRGAMVLALCVFTSCSFDSTTNAPLPRQVDGSPHDASQLDQHDDVDVVGAEISAVDSNSCDPECTSENAVCASGLCVCVDGYHDGGGASGDCVEADQCSPGFGIPTGDTDCQPSEDFCEPETQCTVLSGWEDGACLYGHLEDGTICDGESENPCTLGFECRAGLCEPVMPTCSESRPILLVHGINGSSENYAVMVQRLIDAGWPEDEIFLFDAEDPSWGCNVDNAHVIQALVESILTTTCQPRIDLVAHSMGVVSTRHFLKFLGGVDVVNTYVTLGGMHHGEFWSCLKPDWVDICVWNEICESGEFMEQLNADPATPGDTHWVSIYGSADETIPNESSHLEGAENIKLEGVEHSGPNGLLEREDVFLEVLRVLEYPCW